VRRDPGRHRSEAVLEGVRTGRGWMGENACVECRCVDVVCGDVQWMESGGCLVCIALAEQEGVGVREGRSEESHCVRRRSVLCG